MTSLTLRAALALLCLVFLSAAAGAAEKSTLDGYDRAQVANANYEKMHGAAPMEEAADDPELAALKDLRRIYLKHNQFAAVPDVVKEWPLLEDLLLP